MVLRNTPPGRQKYNLPATRPLYSPTSTFNTNNFVIRAQKVLQNNNASSVSRRSNVTPQSAGYNTLTPNK